MCKIAYGNKSRKGGLGNLIEEKFFGYISNLSLMGDISEKPVEIIYNGKEACMRVVS